MGSRYEETLNRPLERNDQQQVNQETVGGCGLL